MSEVLNRDLHVVADIEDFTDRLRHLDQLHNRLDRITDIAETPCLFPGAEDGHVLSRHGLRNKIRQHHSVTAGLTRADDIKKAHDKNRQLFFLPVSESKKLIQEFRCGVAPTSFGRSAQHHIIIFPEGHLSAFSVHFRRRSNKYRLLFLVCGLKYELRSVDVRLNCSHWALDDQANTHCCRQVKDYIRFVHKFGEQRSVGERINPVSVAPGFLQVLDIRYVSRRQIVQNQNFVPFF